MTIQTSLNLRPAELTRPITGEMLFKMGDIGRTELVKGEIVYMSPTGHPHGFVEFNIGGILREFVRRHNLGRVLGGEAGVYTRRNPDTVRGVDVAFISHKRLAQAQSKGYLDVAPELIVEVLSPDDSWSEVMQKVEEYFSIGTQVVWLVDLRRRQVYLYHSLTEVQHFTIDETLPGGEMLPGFSVPVKELFSEE